MRLICGWEGVAGLALVLVSGAAFAQPTMVMTGIGNSRITDDGMGAVGGVYHSAVDDSVVYRFQRGIGGLPLVGRYAYGAQVVCNSDASVVAVGMLNVSNVGGLGTDREIAHRWTSATGWQNIGMLPNGNRCDFNINTAYDVSGNGRYVVGGGWTNGLCGPFRAWRYDAQTAIWEQLPVSNSGPPMNVDANATRANAVSDDGSVIGGYDQNFDPPQVVRARHAAVWVNTAGVWSETVLDPYGGEVFAVSGDGNVVVGEMSTTTMQATFGTTVTSPVRWVRSGANWIPENLGGSGSWTPTAASQDGSTVVGGYFIWRASINGGVAMDLDTYLTSIGANFGGFTIGGFGITVRDISADGNAILLSGQDLRSDCLTTFTSGAIVYLNGSACEPPHIAYPPDSRSLTGLPSTFGIVLNTFASGSWPLNYQWQKETSPGVWENLFDDHCSDFNANNYDVKGSTTSQLRLGILTNIWQGRYRCVVTNDCGSATTTVASVDTPCPGDVNSDQTVDLADLSSLLANFGTAADATRAEGDLDNDFDVDLSDLAILLANFGSSC